MRVTNEDLCGGDPKRSILLRGFVFLEGEREKTREQDGQTSFFFFFLGGTRDGVDHWD